MIIPVKTKGRKLKVQVKRKAPGPKDPILGYDSKTRLSTAAAKFVEEPEFCTLKDHIYSKKNLAEQLALLSPKEMRDVITAAHHLRKFKDILKTKEEE